MGFCGGDNDENDYELGVRHGIAAVIKVLIPGPDSCYSATRKAALWLESPEGRAAVDAELKKNGGGA